MQNHQDVIESWKAFGEKVHAEKRRIADAKVYAALSCPVPSAFTSRKEMRKLASQGLLPVQGPIWGPLKRTMTEAAKVLLDIKARLSRDDGSMSVSARIARLAKPGLREGLSVAAQAYYWVHWATLAPEDGGASLAEVATFIDETHDSLENALVIASLAEKSAKKAVFATISWDDSSSNRRSR